MYWSGGDSEPPDTCQLPAMAGSSSAAGTTPQVQQELHQLQEQLAAQQQLLGNLKNKMPQASSQDITTRLAAMRSRLNRPPPKHNKKTDAKLPSDIVDCQMLHTESMSVDSSTQPFEVVLKESERGMLSESSKMGGSLADVSVMSGHVRALDASSQNAACDPSIEGIPKKARTSSFSEGSSQSKIQLLRKQLDEKRTKYERQQRDNKEKKASMDEMKKKMEKLRCELEQRNDFIQNLEKGIIPLHSQPTTQQLCQQLLQKDAIVLGLTARVAELESQCQDQADQLGERDSLIEARTEAVTLITKDRDEKIMKMMEDLEERENCMRDLQHRLTAQEEKWKSERDNLTRTLAERSSRLAQVEETQRRTESIRFELAARNAELQEKIVSLQSNLTEVTASMEEEKTKNQLSQNSIQDLKQKLCKAEAHGKSKLKSLEKQVKAIKTGEGQPSGQNILDLHNQIAELEEEKGNLQLRLVDFDDLKSANSTLEESATALRKKLDELTKELDDKSVFISTLENEKIKLVELLNDREKKMVDLEINSSHLQVEVHEISKIKLELEGKVKELNDKNELISGELAELQNEFKLQIEAKENTSSDNDKEELEKNLRELTKELESARKLYEIREKEVETLKEKAKSCELSEQETLEANQRLLGILTDKENSLASYAIEMDSWSDTKAQLENEIRELHERCQRMELEAESEKATQVDEMRRLHKLLADKDSELESLLDEHKIEIQKLLDSVRQTESLQDKLSEMEELFDRTGDELASFKKRNSRLEKAIADNEKVISSLKTELKNLQEALDDNKERIWNYEQLVKELKSDARKTEQNAAKLAELKKETEKCLENKSRELEKLQKDLNNSQKMLEDAQANLIDRTEEVTSLSLERESLLEQVREQQSLADNKQQQIASLAAEIASRSSGVLEQDSVVQMSTADADFIKKCYEEMEAKLTLKNKLLTDVQNQLDACIFDVKQCQAELLEREVTIQDLTTRLAQNEDRENQQRVGIQDLQSNFVTEQKANEELQSNLLQELKLREELQRSLTIEQTTRSELYDTLEQEKELRAELQNSLESYQLAQESVQRQCDFMNSELARSSELTSSLSAQVTERDQQLTELQQELNSIQQVLNEREQQLAEVQRNLTDSNSQLAELQLKLAAREKQAEEMQQKLDAATSQLEKSTMQCAEVSAYQEQAAANATANEQQLQWNQDQVMQMQLDHESKQKLIEEMQSRIEELVAQAEHKDAQTKEFLSELNERQQRISCLESELMAIKSEYDVLMEQYQSASSYYSSLQAEYENLNQSSLSVSSELQLKTTALQEVSDKNVYLEANLDELRRSTAERESSLQNYIEELKDKNSCLESQLATVTDSNVVNFGVNENRTEIEASQRRIRELEEQLNEAVVARDSARSELATRTNAVSVGGERHLEERCRMLEAQLEDAALKIAQLETSLGTASGGAVERQNSLASEELGEVDLGGDGGRASPELRGLQQALLEKTALVEQMQEQLTSLKHSAHSQQEEMAWLNQKIQGLQETNKKLEDRRQELQQQLLQEAEQNSTLCEKITSLEQTLVDVREELSASQSSSSDLIATLNQQLEERNALASSLTSELEAERAQRLHLENISIDKKPSSDKQVDEVIASSEAVQTYGTASMLFSVATTAEASAASWFSDHSAEQRSAVDLMPAPLLEEQTLQPPATTATLVADDAVGAAQEADVNIAEMQYKLAWYEEQWGPFTTLYNELLQQHEEAKTKISQLTALIDATSETGVIHCESSVEGEAHARTDVPLGASVAGGSSDEQMSLSSEPYAALLAQYQESCRRVELLEQQLHEQKQQLQQTLPVGNAVVAADVAAATQSIHATSTQSAASFFTKSGQVSSSGGANFFDAAPAKLDLQATSPSLEERFLAATRDNERLLGEVTEAKKILLETTEQLHAEQISLQRVQAELQLIQQGGSGRMTELEQMVGSAEAEIAKLRGQLNTSQEELNRLQSLVLELEESQEARDSKAAGQLGSLEESLGLLRRENSTLRSELEVMEGENSRRSTDIEILESENTRLRTDLETSSQAAQMLEAEKESLVVEIQRLETGMKRLREQVAQGDEALTQSSDQIRALHEQLLATQEQLMHQQQLSAQQHEQLTAAELKLQEQLVELQQQQLSTQLAEAAAQQCLQAQEAKSTAGPAIEAHELHEEELDWGSEGCKDVEHLQRSSSQDASLREEVRTLKEQLIAAEKERNGLSDDLQAAKIKSGKLLQKVKGLQSANEALQKDVSKLKSKGGLSDLDQALEEEFKHQVAQAQAERDELKQKLEEFVKEKDQLTRQNEVLKDAHDRLIEIKEDQEAQIRVFSIRNQDLEANVGSLEWRISELEETVEEERRRPRATSEATMKEGDEQPSSEDTKHLKDRIIALESQLDELSSNYMKIESLNKDLNGRLGELEAENARLLSIKESLDAELKLSQQTNIKANEDVGVYKEAFIEQQGQFEKLTEEKNSLSNDLGATDYQLRTMKSAYNALFEEHEEMKADNAAMKHDFLTLEGERDRLLEDVAGLTAELEAYRQETIEGTVRGLEDELAALRETCNALKEEKEQNERISNSAVEMLARRERYTEAESAALAKQNETLTEELARRRREMDNLEEQVRHWQQQTQHLSRQVESADASLSRLSEAAVSPAESSAELEAALASLHLRDLRCHQLIIEINKLVEERDSLQLRLSAALRSNQDLVRRCQGAAADAGEAPLASPAGDDISPPLKTKLDELRELNDVVEQKTMASVPPHPTIVTPEYTLTRETQATSSTLINWIMGRTTPRVMHV
ncbi:protein lava lamp isoform X2 [Hyalella azteca]|uniref:Protein lava lamp isoform X2 n=1 Tax=Hyalella azteca TaxID=294128 RepID=A0A8B7P7K0_HYAAZ|nr:protein lava lamp isoform X2 [Hyalella azteca]